MNKKRLGIGVAALVLLALFLWLGRSDAPLDARAMPSDAPLASPGSPASTELTTTTTPSPGAERAPIAVSAEVVPTKAPAFALIRVLVLEKTTERPLLGASVSGWYDSDSTVHAVAEAQGQPFERTKTGVDGRVEIQMPQRASVTVNVDGREIDAGAERVSVPALAAGETREIVVHLPTGNDLPFWMKLVEEETLTPIPWAAVIVSGASKAAPNLTTDTRGLVFCAARTWSITTIRIEPPRRPHLYLEPEPGHATVETALVVTVPAAATLRVEVTDASGAAVRGAKVVLTTEGYHLSRSQGLMASLRVADPRWSEKTDENGIALLTGLPVRVPLRASLASPKPWNAGEPIVLAPGETRNVAWKLSSGATLRGVVIDQQQKPVTDRSIWLRPAAGKRTDIFNDYSSGPTRTTKTNADGRFEFADVDAGHWSVGPSAPSLSAKVPSDDVPALAHYIEIVAEQKDVEVTIRIDRGLFIRGRVLDPDGNPARSGGVQASDPVTRLGTGAQLEDATGKFAVGPLMTGRYVLVADGGKHAASDRVEADAGTEGVELRLKVGGSLAGRVISQEGTTVEAKVVLAQRNSKTARSFWLDTQKGGFKVESLEAATYDLAASTTDGSVGVLEGIELSAGETRSDLAITVSPGGRVRVRHEGPDSYVGVRILQRDIMYGGDSIQRGVARDFVAPAGRVTVRATYPDGEYRTVERVVDVKAGETVEVTFEKGSR